MCSCEWLGTHLPIKFLLQRKAYKESCGWFCLQQCTFEVHLVFCVCRGGVFPCFSVVLHSHIQLIFVCHCVISQTLFSRTVYFSSIRNGNFWTCSTVVLNVWFDSGIFMGEMLSALTLMETMWHWNTFFFFFLFNS